MDNDIPDISDNQNKSREGDQQYAFLVDNQPDHKRSGCYLANPEQFGRPHTQVLVPLIHLNYSLEIVNSLLNITITQQYYNPTHKYMEVNYSLPITPESSIHKFQAQFNNITIEGVVKERQEAEKQYEKAKSEGKQVAIAQLDKLGQHVFSMAIGNIPPHTEFLVTIQMLQQLRIIMSTFYELRIPSAISPRYLSVVNNNPISQLIKSKEQLNGYANFTWNFKVNLNTNRRVSFYKCPTHKLKLINQNKEETELLFLMEKEEVPSKDFCFLFTTQEFHLPSYVLGKSDTTSTVVLSFIPKFCNLSADDAYQARMNNEKLQIQMQHTKGEYVFFLDRSGSMGGARIKKAKQALIMFLKSLPQQSFFNVISFGSNSDKMFDQSVNYTSQKFKQARNKILKMEADMGGTQIHKPLQKALQQHSQKGYARHVFLLTDGEVADTQSVIEMVKNNIRFSRVHCIGIGNGVSHSLIQGCSEAGRGKYVLIADNQNPSNKIILILEASLSPLITKLDLKVHNLELIESIVPDPQKIPYILKDDVINFYVTYKKLESSHLSFTFEYEDSLNDQLYKSQINLNVEKSKNYSFVDKMAHLKVLQNLETLAKHRKRELIDMIYYVKEADHKKQAINYSIKYQLLSEYTAFLCIGKQLIDGQYQQFRDTKHVSIDVLQNLPIEYLQKIKELNQKKQNQSEEEQQQDIFAIIGGYKGSGGWGQYQINIERPAGDQRYTDTREDERSREPTYGLAQKRRTAKKQVILSLNLKRRERQAPKISQNLQLKLVESKDPHSRLAKTHKGTYTTVQKIIDIQDIGGSWSEISLIDTLALHPQETKKMVDKFGYELIATQLAVLWIQKYYPEKQYALIIKKGVSWLKKQLSCRGLQLKQLSMVECI